MPGDIRSYLIPKSNKSTKEDISSNNKKGSNKRIANIIDEDDDVIPESPQTVQKDKKKKRVRAISSSDDESDNFQSKIKSTKSVHTAHNSRQQTNKKSPKKELKQVNPMDIFGKGPVKRVMDANETKSIKKSKTELDVHDDANFDKTLIELDDSTPYQKNEIISVDDEPKHVNTTTKKSSSHSESKTPKKSVNKSPRSGNLESKNDKLDSRSHSKTSQSPGSPKHHVSSRTRSSSRTPQKSSHKSSEKSPHGSKSSERNSRNTPSKKSSSNHNLSSSGDKSSRPRSSSRTQKTKHESNASSLESVTRKIKMEDTKEHSGKDRNHSKDKKDSPPSKKSNKTVSNVKNSHLEKKLELSEKLHTKKDFSMFMNDTPDQSGETGQVVKSPEVRKNDLKSVTPKSESKSKKRKTLDTSIELTEEERQERKRASAVLYQSFQNRTGPKHPGSKEVPEGDPNCLSGLAFLVTGVLDCFEKEEIEQIVKKFGGDFKKSMLKKVSYVICGEDCGPAKLSMAENLKIPIITEDDFLQLIKDNTSKKSNEASNVKKESVSEKRHKESPTKEYKKVENKKQIAKKDSTPKENESNINEQSKYFSNGVKVENTVKPEIQVSEPTRTDSGSSVTSLTASAQNDIPWVDKYKPQTLKQMIGQQGEKSCVNKLLRWLSEWYVNRKKNIPKPNPWSGDKTGAYYKAALLSGPPGVGKTTSVGLVCKELGYDTVEFNASDTRSKTLLKEHLSDLVSTNSLAAFSQGKLGKGAVTKKHIIIMDEVDGMAGNEDRGGMQELLALIKQTSVPIICMCNDKTSPKMRSLSSNCYDLTFQRAKVDQIKGAMLSVCYKEGVKIPPSALAQMITATNQDIRQVLNLLSVWSSADKNLTSDSVDKDSNKAHKDMKLGPWEVVRKVFSSEDHKNMSIHDKSNLFFHDYSIGPLFVQQNYLKVVPKCDKKDTLKRFADAADSISLGDVVESKIRSNMAWSLLPLQAMYSSVIPGSLLAGHMAGQIDFPSWLGQNSKRNKLNRLTQELHSHTSLSTSGSKMAIRLDYAKHLRDSIINPLIRNGTDGVQQSLQVLQDYHLLKEDLDSLLELTQWPGQKDPYAMVETKVKTALTKTYNKEAAPLPYSQMNLKKAKSNVNSQDYGDMESEDIVNEEDVEEDSDVEHDAMIKSKVSKVSLSSSSKATKSSKASTKISAKK